MCTTCLLPPPVDKQTIDNQPPYLLSQQSRPLQGYFELNLNCSECTFLLQAEDLDRQDTLYSRWFIDYDLGNTFRVCENTILPSTKALIPRVQDSCVIQVQEQFLSSSVDRVLTLEAFVADRPFNSIDGRSLPADARFVSQRWMIKLVRPRQAQCVSSSDICRGSI